MSKYAKLMQEQQENDWQDYLRLARQEHEFTPGYGILRSIVDKELSMKWLIYRGEWLAGCFFDDNKEEGFEVWCLVSGVTHPDNYTVVPAP